MALCTYWKTESMADDFEEARAAERGALERVLLANLEEQRRSRRWGVFFKSLAFVWLFLVLIVVLVSDSNEFSGGPHTALIEISGEIGAEDGVVADHIISALKDAFDDGQAKGVVLRCNSPGGSPVQSGQIYDEIKRLRGNKPAIPVYAVVDDICASGGYYIIAAADKIFVDKASMIGSIGVLMDGFGFTEGMKKLGIERRLLTAGENKGFLDPFSPVKEKDVEFARAMLGEVHQQFIQSVRQGRGKRLKESPDIFSGLIWSGAHGIEIGLADGLGSLDYVAREILKAEDVVDYTPKQDIFDRLSHRVGVAIGQAMRPWAHEVAHVR
jgi:protease-4